ncbi:MAG TPA: hypothetical protein VHW67_06990 [Solirubrobacteraceae bacterium]|jgi:hypothetical protein|nr:hypothetical protein [Solirubrobacteraceae bacterium]
MKQIKILGLALVAMFALTSAVMATTAMAVELPDVHIALGEKFPVTAEGEITGAKVAKLETGLKEAITAEKVTGKLEVTALSSLGPLVLVFTGTKLGANDCLGEGDPAETITVKGEWHLLDKVIAGKLTLLIMVLFTDLKITCLKIKITVKAPAITQVTKVADMVQTTEFGAQPKCVGAGKQEVTEYENDEGKLLTKQLLSANLGLGNESACEEFGKELVLKANKMIEFLF